MSGMLGIPPKQVATVKQFLQPADAAIDFIPRVIEEYAQSGQAVFEIEGNMGDAPVIERCRQLLGQLLAK